MTVSPTASLTVSKQNWKGGEMMTGLVVEGVEG